MMLALLLLQAPPPQVLQATASELPPGLQARVEALEKAKDWAGLADLIEAQTPAVKGLLLETWLKALSKAGRHERVVAIAEAAIPQMEAGKGPRLSTARLYRAQALSALGRRAEAAEAHAENGRLGWAEGFASACVETQALGDWPGLEARGAELEKVRPTLGLAYRGEALCKQGRYPEAEPLLERAIALEGAPAMAWSNLSACRAQRSAFVEALAAADRAVALDAGCVEGHYNRGVALFGLKRYAEGRDALRAAQATGKADPALSAQIQHHIARADEYLAFQAKQAEKASGSKGKKTPR